METITQVIGDSLHCVPSSLQSIFFLGGGRRRKEKCHKAMSFRVNTYLVRYVIQQSSSAGEFLKSHVSSKMKTERSY